MSIAYFPRIYEDELVYSVLARFYHHNGYPNYRLVAEDLFVEKSQVPSIEFLYELKQEVLDILLRDCTMEEIVLMHTMFPYYGRFIPKEDRKEVYRALVNMKKGCIGLLRIPKRGSRKLCYCPLCVKDDRNRYGETYWHRIHQMAGVGVCPIHKCYLQDSGISLDTRKSPSLISIEELELNMEVDFCKNMKEVQLAEYIMKVFLMDLDVEKEVMIGDFLQGQLYFTKYMAKNGGCRRSQLLYEDFMEYYGSDIRYGITEQWHLQKMFAGERINVYEICQLAMFLDIPVDSLTEMNLPEKSQQMLFNEKVKEMRAKGIGVNKIGRELGVSSLTVRKVGKYEPRKHKNYKTKGGCKKKDWEQIDRDTLPKVRDTIKHLYGDKEDRPHRITRYAVCKELGLYKSIFRYLPYCREEILKYEESQEQYWAREMVWAVKDLQKNGKEVNFTQIMKKTNMRKENITACLPDFWKIAPPDVKEILENLI